jgi:hypothetical protein
MDNLLDRCHFVICSDYRSDHQLTTSIYAGGNAQA